MVLNYQNVRWNKNYVIYIIDADELKRYEILYVYEYMFYEIFF